jgi:bifunctional enzyme CysN/CysC
MDLVGHDEAVFEEIQRTFGAFLRQFDLVPSCFIPVAGRDGENVATRAASMPWYTGPTVLEALDSFTTDRSAADRPFRMPVQGVYKFTEDNDERRIVAGTVVTGTLSVGDEVVFFPSGKRSRVKSIEAFNLPRQRSAVAGMATGFTLQEQIYVARGEMAARADEPKPQLTTRLRVSLFWLGKQPLNKRTEYQLKLGSARVCVRVEAITRVMNASTLETLESSETVGRNDVAECVLKLDRAIAFDVAADIAETGRFVLVEDFEIRGGGIVREALPDRQSWVRERVLLRNYMWEPSGITSEQRAERLGQLARLVLITGERDTDRKAVARELEARLFADGRQVYFLGIGNVLYGVDADIGRERVDRSEHMRRLAEIANLVLDTGAILIVTAVELTPDDLEIIKAGVDADRVTTVWIGDDIVTDLPSDLRLSERLTHAEAAGQIKLQLRDQGVVFRPW